MAMLGKTHSWKTGCISVERRSFWKDVPVESWQGQQPAAPVCSRSWPEEPRWHSAVEKQIYQRCLFSHSVGPFVFFTAYSSQCLMSLHLFPESVSITAAAVIFCIFPCLMCRALGTALHHAVLWAGSSVDILSNQWASGGLHLFLRASDPTVYSHLHLHLQCVVMSLGHEVFLSFLE